MKKIFILLIGAFTLLLPSVVFASGGADPSLLKTVIYSRGGDSVGLDLARETDGNSFNPGLQIVERLIDYDYEKGEFVPSLATSWAFSADGLSVSLDIRKGVKFHDGTDLNAEAVAFNFLRQFDESIPEYAFGPWKYWGYQGLNDIIESVTPTDTHTLEITLKQKDATFIAVLSMEFLSIPSPTAVKKFGEDYTNNPVGTGPFKFVSWTKDDSIVLEKNSDYWGGNVNIDRLIYRTIPDATARYLALQKGEVDIVEYPNYEDIPEMQSDANLTVHTVRGLNMGYLSFNTQRAPFDNLLVRQALSHAINKQEIIDGIFGNAGVAAVNPLPPDMWGYLDVQDPYPYDPEKARQLLAEAGFANGFDTEVWGMPVPRPYNPNGVRMAEILQSQFADVGVRAEVITYDWGTYLERTDQGQHPMALLGWSADIVDPDNFLGVLLSGDNAVAPASNISYWNDPEYTQIIRAAKQEFDTDIRVEYYHEAQRIVHKEAPLAPIAHSTVFLTSKNTIKGINLQPNGLVDLSQLSVE